MLRVANARDCLRGFRRLLDRGLEELLGCTEKLRPVAERALAEQRAPNLQHQIDVVGVAELQRAAEAAHRRIVLPELQQGFAKAGQAVLVLRLEDQRLLERTAGPSILLARELRVTYPNMQLHRIRVERESFAKHAERIVVLPFVVELMRTFVVLFRTQERGGHRQQASSS